MTVKFSDKPFRDRIERDKRRFLIAAGQVGVNQAVDLSRVDTGLSRNAKYFSVSGFDSDFGAFPGKGGEIVRPDEGLKERPRETGVVNIYAPLSYDVYLERRYKTLERSLQLAKGLFNELVKRIFR